jgi:NAD(P)-dependent dehydrogenase (short-subunit alcohol dehydrogenase family)
MEILSGKVVLITGAARGMGKLHAANFAREGSVVVLTDVDEPELEKTVEGLKSQGYRAHGYRLDVSDRDACIALAEKVISEVGPIDVLVNNAGITECVPILDQSEAALRRMTDVNYLGQVWMMQAVVPDMVKRRFGHVVNIASVAGKVGTARMGAYCATKHANIAVTDAIRQELRGSGVTFTIINPGYVSTGMFEGGTIPIITSWQEPQKISDAVVNAVKKDKAEVCVPWFNVRQVAFVRGLCVPRFMDAIFHLFGVDKSMDNWRKDECRPF